MHRVLPPTFSALIGFLAAPSLLTAQAAVDPSIAPRAAQLARAGGRQQATELLGHYLATAPDDGAAWLELGKFYLADSREWHRNGHSSDPPAEIYLDFAATALDQSLRLPTDSGFLIRALVEVERAAGQVEYEGWRSMRTSFAPAAGTHPPAFVVEAGRNLVNSCPVGGVLVTGTDLEAVATWSAVFESPGRGDLVLLLGPRFATDSVYRRQMSETLDIQAQPSTRAALAAAAIRRPICFSPASDTAFAPSGAQSALRLVRVAGPRGPESAEPLSVVRLLEAEYAHPDAVTSEVLALYREAARANPALCSSLLAPLGAHERAGCGR